MKVIGLVRRVRDKSRGTARFEDGVVEDGDDVARRQDEQFVRQGRQRQSSARCEAMFGRQRDDQGTGGGDNGCVDETRQVLRLLRRNEAGTWPSRRTKLNSRARVCTATQDWNCCGGALQV